MHEPDLDLPLAHLLRRVVHLVRLLQRHLGQPNSRGRTAHLTYTRPTRARCPRREATPVSAALRRRDLLGGLIHEYDLA